MAGIQNSQEITHETNLVGAEADAESFVHTMSELGDRLDPLLLQLPPSFTVEGMGVLEDFFKGLPEMLREHAAALTLINYPRMPRMEEATAQFSYIRWLGDRREFPEGHTHPKKNRDDELLWWSEIVERILQENRTVFAYAKDHYQNHFPSTLDRLIEIRRGER